jgi:hypothetical protein
MFEDQHYAIVSRGVDDALACRDMLAPAPPHPSLLARLRVRFERAVRTVIRRRAEIQPTRPRAVPLELTH